MQHKFWNRATPGALLGVTLGLAACGGGGGHGAPPAIAKCAAIAGAADPVQEQLEVLSATAAGIPGAGPAAAGLTEALNSITDVVDAVAAAIQGLALSQDPAQLTMALDQAGSRVSCGLDEAAVALEQLNSGALAGTPAASAVTLAIAQIAVVQGILESDPLADGAGDLAVLTAPIEVLASRLTAAATVLPVAGPGVPETHLAMDALSGSLTNLTALLNEVAQLDHAGTAAALVNYYEQLAEQLSAVPQAQAAASGAAATLEGGLVMLLEPVFTALRTVLGGPAPFDDIVLGLITATPINGGFADLIGLLDGHGSVPDPAELLAGVPVLGELAAEILGSSGDPADVMADILHGVPGMPTLAEVLAQLPGLGGSSPPSVAEIQQIVEDVLALNGGVPVIADILEQVGGEFTALNLDEVTDLLNGLLGGLL